MGLCTGSANQNANHIKPPETNQYPWAASIAADVVIPIDTPKYRYLRVSLDPPGCGCLSLTYNLQGLTV